MGTKYTTNTISGYNETPVADDGSETAANKIKFVTITTNLTEPLKTLTEAINTDLVNHFDNASDAEKTGAYTVDADDYDRMVVCNGTFTVSLTAAATLGNGFKVPIKNVGTGTITIDADGAETIDGETTLALDVQHDPVMLRCDGSNWHTTTPSTTVIKQGKHAILIPASAMRPAITSGCATLLENETGVNDVNYQTLDFDTASDERAVFQLPMPGIWDEGTLTFQPYWTAASGSGTVTWALQARAFSDNDAIDQAYGTAVTSGDTLITTEDMHIGPESAAMTVAGTPAAGDMVFFRLYRDVSADTLSADAKLIAIKLFLTIDGTHE